MQNSSKYQRLHDKLNVRPSRYVAVLATSGLRSPYGKYLAWNLIVQLIKLITVTWNQRIHKVRSCCYFRSEFYQLCQIWSLLLTSKLVTDLHGNLYVNLGLLHVNLILFIAELWTDRWT